MGTLDFMGYKAKVAEGCTMYCTTQNSSKSVILQHTIYMLLFFLERALMPAGTFVDALRLKKLAFQSTRADSLASQLHVAKFSLSKFWGGAGGLICMASSCIGTALPRV